MNIELAAGLIEGIVGHENLKIAEPMKDHTTFRIGGPADILVTPHDMRSIAEIIKLCKLEEIPSFIMGNGSNLLVGDKGIRGVVIKLFNNLSSFSVNDCTIKAEAGILLSRVSKIALEYELTGMEFAEGIPGTLGGAVAMNAGAYNGEMKNTVVTTEYMDKNGEINVLHGEQHKFAYRTSFIQQRGGIVLSTELKLNRGSKDEIKAAMDDFNSRRRDRQPLDMPSAGSVFKRPEGYYVGPLIEGCGLKGYSIGGAEVSTKHCGFIVNKGNATASDVRGLIRHIQDCVRSKYGVVLETEVRTIGEE